MRIQAIDSATEAVHDIETEDVMQQAKRNCRKCCRAPENIELEAIFIG